jgi:hypothetical protein
MKDKRGSSTENSGQKSGPNRGRRENLKPWAKGVSGNPGGRPKKRPISEEYALLAGMELPESLRLGLKLPKGATYASPLALGQFRAGIKGKTEAAREIREGIEGKATQKMQVSGADGGAVKLDLKTTLQRIRQFYGLAPESAGESSVDSATAAGVEAREEDSPSAPGRGAP